MYPEQPNNAKQKAVATIVILLAVVLIAVSVKACENKQKHPVAVKPVSQSATANSDTSSPDTSSSGSTSDSSSSGSSASASYKDGTYTASSDYYVPHGAESIKVTLTVKNGIITDSSIENSETNPESASFQESFASGYKSYVVGKSISGLRLSYTAGASDTAQGFNDALQQIQTQAQA